jgi:hypothetical protein
MPGIVLLAVSLAYVASVLTVVTGIHVWGAFVGGLGPWSAIDWDIGLIEDLIGFSTLIGAYAFPGFVVLRLGLWWSGLSHWAWFAVAGALAGLLALLLAGTARDPMLYVIGAVAGSVYRPTEYAVLRGRVEKA